MQKADTNTGAQLRANIALQLAYAAADGGMVERELPRRRQHLPQRATAKKMRAWSQSMKFPL